MVEHPPTVGAHLGTIRKPASGWGPSAASELNNLVRPIAAAHDWRHLVVRMHQSTWNQVAAYLNYNLSFPKPCVPMDCQGYEDRGRLEVVHRTAGIEQQKTGES
jgi:hypothetical protein